MFGVAIGALTVFVWLVHNEVAAISDYLEDQDYDIHIHPPGEDEPSYTLEELTKFAQEWKKELEQDKTDEQSHNGHRKD